MGIFDREKVQAATPIPTPVERLMSVTADQLQCVLDDWKRAEHAVRDEVESRGSQLWAQAQAAVAKQNVDELVRLGELMAASRPDLEHLDLREAVFARINKFQYTPSMMHIAEMITLSSDSQLPSSDAFEYRPTYEQ
jgi:hypothetical protein